MVPWYYFQATMVVITIITFQWLKVGGKKLFSTVEHEHVAFIWGQAFAEHPVQEAAENLVKLYLAK